ncbi:hypothetical protein SLS62_007398 [Diatrype stigma]|uniref:FAD-binding PCMH-type domain-containing protein n=1 Tax=Diatrype stigma TaxID=117547 RepID=A0AAN9UZG4_9PEZI
MDITKVLGETQWPADTTVSFPNSAKFNESTERWTVYSPPSYLAAITPSDEGAVVKAVQVATAHNIPFLATGGRHGYTATFGSVQNGLAIDLSQLNPIDIDASTSTITVGGGVRIGDVIDPLYQSGFELRLVGATLGGGLGRYQGLHGLTIDALISVRLVTADGRAIEVSEDSYPDLFWGIRGAGTNFGVVTSATYKIHKLTNKGQILNADFVFTGDATTAYFETLESFGTFPAELVAAQGFFWDANSNSTVLISNWVYIGPEEKGRELMTPIVDLGPVVANVSVVPYNKLIQTMAFGGDANLCVPGKSLVTYSVNVRQLSVPTYGWAFDKISDFFAQYPAARSSSVIFETFPNQALMTVHQDKTSYPWRDAKGNFVFQFSVTKEDSALDEAANALGRELRSEFARTSGYPGLSVYTSYANGDETPEQIYGKHQLPRLAALKKEWDPTNVFRYSMNLPTQYP